MTGSAQHIENGQANSVDKKTFWKHLKVHTVHITFFCFPPQQFWHIFDKFEKFQTCLHLLLYSICMKLRQSNFLKEILTYRSYLAMYCLLWKVLEACLPSLTPELHDKLDETISEKDKNKGKEATWNSYAETNGLSLFLWVAEIFNVHKDFLFFSFHDFHHYCTNGLPLLQVYGCQPVNIYCSIRYGSFPIPVFLLFFISI